MIEATIDHDAGFVRSKEMVDVYCTREPQLAFHQRIKFCLNMHNQSVKDMRFPPKSYSKDLESAEVGGLYGREGGLGWGGGRCLVLMLSAYVAFVRCESEPLT